jgi:hypothetical protein
MLANAASPQWVLSEGLVYSLPRDVARRLMEVHPVLKVAFAEPAPAGSKVERIPATPDPEDLPENVVIDEADELLDAE